VATRGAGARLGEPCYDPPVRLVLLLGLVGCGRLDFDPVGGGGDANPGGGDGKTDGVLAIDAPASACADAVVVSIGRSGNLDTCLLPDRIDGCGGVGSRELIVRFDPPATAGYTFRAFDGATQNTSNSVSVIDDTCTTRGSCAGVLGITGTAGTPMYLVVEASGGPCATIQFSVQ